MATALATIEPPEERFVWAEKVVSVLETGGGAAGDGAFGMLVATAVHDFASPVMLLASTAATRSLPPISGRSRDVCEGHMSQMSKGLKLAVRLLRVGLGGDTSLLASVQGQLQLVRFGSRLAKALRRCVPNAVRMCTGLEGVLQEDVLLGEVNAMLHESADVVDALRSISARLGRELSKEAKSAAGGGRLCADLLLASLHSCSWAPIVGTATGFALPVHPNPGDSDSSGEGEHSRGYYAVRSTNKRVREEVDGDTGDGLGTDIDGDEEIAGQEEGEEESTIIINFKKKT